MNNRPLFRQAIVNPDLAWSATIQNMNWRELPFVRLLLPCIAGVLSAHGFQLFFSPVFFLSLLAVLIAILTLLTSLRIGFRWRSLFGLLLSATLFLMFHHHASPKGQPSALAGLAANEIGLVGCIKEIKERENGFRIVLELQGIRLEGQMVNCSEKLLLYLRNEGPLPNVREGNLWAGITQIRPIEGPRNPYVFDFRAYMARQDIHFQAFAEAKDGRVINGFAPGFRDYIPLMRQQALEVLQKVLPGEQEFAVGAALLLGDKSALPDEIREAYANTGAMHVLAVSGLHVGIVYMLLLGIFGLVRKSGKSRGWVSLTISLLVIWCYALLTGGSPSVLRAATMFSFLTIGRSLQRHSSIYNTLAASAFLLILIHPAILLEIGFQLSYLAVIGIVFFQRRIYGLLFFQSRLLDYAWQLTSVSVAAQLLTLPISLYYFHQFPVYFWISGLLVIPAATFILVLGLLFFVLSPIPWLSAMAGKVLNGTIYLVNRSILFIDGWPFAIIDGIHWSACAVLVAYSMICSGMAALAFRQFRWILLALCFANILAGLSVWQKLHQEQQQELIIYHLPKQSLIDLTLGDRIISLTSDTIENNKLSWTALPYRSRQGVETVENYAFSEQFCEASLCYKDNVLQFGNQLMFVIDRNKELPELQHWDYCLLRGNPRVDWAALARDAPNTHFIADGSNTSRFTEQWEQLCDSLGLQLHITAEQGAFRLPIH